jgi:hypothetical protein
MEAAIADWRVADTLKDESSQFTEVIDSTPTNMG